MQLRYFISIERASKLSPEIIDVNTQNSTGTRLRSQLSYSYHDHSITFTDMLTNTRQI